MLVEKIAAEAGAKVTFPVRSSAMASRSRLASRVAGAEVSGVVKATSWATSSPCSSSAVVGYRRRNGHRQQYTSVLIEDIKG